jgi:hypothetical protein
MAILDLRLLEDYEGESRLVRNNLLREVVGKQYRRKWLAKLSTTLMSEEEVLSDPALTTVGIQLGQPYPGNALATVVSVTVSNTPNKKMKFVNVVYDTDRLVALATDDPLNQPPEVYFGTFKYNAPLIFDQLGVPVLTSAGNRFDPIPSYEYSRHLITINRNIPEFPMARKRQYNFKLNLKAFLEFPPLTGRINDIQGRRMLSNGRIFWQETTEMEFRIYPDSFFDYYLDADYRNITGNINIDPFSRQPYTNPQLLNGRGYLAETATHTLLANITPDTKTYDISAVPALLAKFPPPPANALANGLIPGPNNTEFAIELRDKTDKTKFEVMIVEGGIDTGVFKLKRKTLGATQTNWVSTTADVRLLAYYRKYTPYVPVDWEPLNFGVLGLQ